MCLGCKAKIIMSDCSTATILSFVIVTCSTVLKLFTAVVFLSLKYKDVNVLFLISPLAIELPKFPVPIMAIFIMLVLIVDSFLRRNDKKLKIRCFQFQTRCFFESKH